MVWKIILVFCLLLTSVMAVANQYINEDLFLSLAAGRDILSLGPTAPDHWAFTAEHLLWVNQSWLTHVGLYLLYAWFGPAGPVAAKIILLGACLALLWARCRALAVEPETCLVAMILGILSLAPFLGIRPENVGVLLFLIFGWLLTNSYFSRTVRGISLPLVMVVWSNAHGSFMLGMELLVVKTVLVTYRYLFQRGGGTASNLESRDVVAWWLVTIASLVGVAFVNPFGIENVLMPFRQLGTAEITSHSADWLPLLEFRQEDMGILGGRSPFPYLFFLCATMTAWMVLACWGRKEWTAGLIFQDRRADWIMELLIAGATVAIAFRFGRLALFAAPSLVPVAALAGDELGRRIWQTEGGRWCWVKLWPFMKSMLVGMGLVVLGFTCYRLAVIPHLPGNPFRPERALVRELMSFDSFSPQLVQFMKENQVTDRILSGWGLSSFLMFHIPEIRLFMDCRDQSYYPSDVIRDYFTVLGINRSSHGAPLLILDKWRVEAVALTTGPIDFRCAMELMKSKRWSCLYADPQSFLLVRTNSPRFGTMLRSGRLTELVFPDESSRILTHAVLGRFTIGQISTEVLQGLREEIASSPWPNLYSLLVWGSDDPRKCLRPDTVTYLTSEMERLIRINPLYANGAEQITLSLVRILEILEENAVRCSDHTRASILGGLRATWESRYQQMRRYYLGYLW